MGADPAAAAPAPQVQGATVSLANAVALALERNFGLLSAGDSLQAAGYRESASRAEFYPKLTPRYARSSDEQVVSVEAAQRLPWTGGSIAAAGTYRSTDAETSLPDSSDLRVVLTQPLLRGFGPTVTSYDLTNSRRARQAQERSYELSRQQLAIDVTAAYFQVIRQRQLLDVARQSLRRSEGLQEASEARMQVGLASRLDVLRAELQAAQARDSMVSAETALETALEQFRIALGASPHEPFEPEDVSLAALEPEDAEPVEVLVPRALANRLELRESQDEVMDAERTLKVVGQSLLPSLDVNLAFTQTGFGSGFSDSWRRTDHRTEFFFSTSYPVERTADRAAKAVAQLDVEARRRNLRQREYDVEAQVRAAARNLSRIRKSVLLQRQSVDLAEQQQRLANLRYQRGLASNFDVVDAEGNLVSARSSLVSLLAEYQVARLQLLKATGSLDVEREFAR